MSFPIISVLWATLATLCYAVFLYTPKKSLLSVSLVGGAGYLIYNVMMVVSEDIVFSTFIASSVVGYMSELLARKRKAPAIIFAIPGILPLAPGYGLYKTMEYFINDQYDLALEKGLTTFMVAGAISLGIIIVTTMYRTFANKNTSTKRKEDVCKEGSVSIDEAC